MYVPRGGSRSASAPHPRAGFLYAPVKAGQLVATAEVLLDGHPSGIPCPLRAKEEIKIAQKERRSFWQKLWNE